MPITHNKRLIDLRRPC